MTKFNYPYTLHELAGKKLPLLQAEHRASWGIMQRAHSALDLERSIKRDLVDKIAHYIGDKLPIRVTDEHENVLYHAEAVICSRKEALELLYEAYRIGFSDAVDRLPPSTKFTDGP